MNGCILPLSGLCAEEGCTVEFLVEGRGFVFLEINSCIDARHAATEEVTGVDLVAVQLMIAGGLSFDALDLSGGIAWRSRDFEPSGELVETSGIAIQVCVKVESMTPDGHAPKFVQAVPIAAFAQPLGCCAPRPPECF